ncbi:DUF4145 domain-containing protein [Massilia sp. 9I]|uniref:DUF4145 domain-containing protein n=1 Tax=Massilia sp. 9I TaxID=2653152 RepID=UPI0012F46625|nr:DUF4145 domain-containing protein [Massilia sp. 9I]VXC04862.1 conserved hypothetical protein [Massilia sp. 9I]
MEPKYLAQSFVADNVPPWQCPNCCDGRLKLVGNFVVKDDAATARSWGEEWFEPEHAHYVFNGLLQCANCSEHVVVCGDGFVEEDYDEEGRKYYTVLTPKFFYPTLKIITPNTNEKVPDEVMAFLEKAFQVFWCDADASVNRLRTVLEYILDDLGVVRENGKGDRLDLSSRISKLTDPKFDQVKAAMTSIRHMGNDGSHGSIGIERRELLAAFAVVNYCLEQLYPKIPDHTAVLEFVEKVNKQKGFRPK